jgi:hypothetical protein
MQPSALENQKLLLKTGLVYQTEQASRNAEITENERDKRFYHMMVEELGNILIQVDELKSISKTKQWFRDISEAPIENGDINYQIYLEVKTGLKIDLFNSLIKKVTQYLKAGKINTEGQYRDVELAIQLYTHQKKPEMEISALDKLLFKFQQKHKK